MKEPDRRIDHVWHVAINQHSTDLQGKNREWPTFMYEAKNMAYEVPRMTKLFRLERENTLPKSHQQCSYQAEEPIIDNHLTCCMGKKCSVCPHLLALEKIEHCSPEDIDTAKAWTCAAHIVSNGGDYANEGYLLTVGDRMFWNNVHESLASTTPPEIK